jgi:hypothetical protein
MIKTIPARPPYLWPIFLVFFPLTVHADAMIPYMVVPWGQVFLLPIVIFVEGYILRKILGGKFYSALIQSCIANIASTILGVALYFITMPLIGEGLFYWWFKGGFSSEAVRNACIAILFAAVLWVVSWLSEMLVIAHMRKTSSDMKIVRAAAIANLATYSLLLTLAIWFGKGESEALGLENVDVTRNSSNIESLLTQDKKLPFVGYWRTECANNFGLAIEAMNDGKSTVAFCGPGGCDSSKSLVHTTLINDPRYRIIDQNTISKESYSGTDIYHRCAPNR